MFKFIDLFSGIGGFRLACQRKGGVCVFSSEIDPFAVKTYSANFKDTPSGDLRKVPPEEIPSHDLLCAGFPCQPFSQAGLRLAFSDKEKGELFFLIPRILREKRPKFFILENVKGLLSVGKGEPFNLILKALRDVGYKVAYKVLHGEHWVPQSRDRLFIVGSTQPLDISWPTGSVTPVTPLKEIIQPSLDGYTLGRKTWEFLQAHKRKHQQRNNGFGYTLHTLPIQEGVLCRTLSARYGKDGAECLIEQKGKPPRKLSPLEAAQIQGFPASFVFPVSNTQAYRQIGNSVIPPMVESIIETLQYPKGY